MARQLHTRTSAAIILVCAAVLSGRARADSATGALPISEAPPPRSPAPSALNVTAPIPSHGGIIISSVSGATPMVQLSQPPSTPIAGELRALGRYWIWRALAPIEPGAYQLIVSNGNGDGIVPGAYSTHAVTVGAAWEPEPPTFTSMPSARAVDTALERVCCRYFDGQALLEGQSCPATRATSQVLVDPGLQTTAPTEQRDQFMVRARPAMTPSDDADARFGPASFPAYASFTEQAEEYCFEIDAIDIVSRQVHTSVATGCIAHGTLPSLEPHDVEVQDAALHPSTCSAPPVGFEARWCALNEAHCTTYPTLCHLFGHICRGEPLPEPVSVEPHAGASGMSGFETGSMGGAGGATRYPITDRDPNRRVDGCRAAPAASSMLGGVAWVATALWLGRRKRRSVRRERVDSSQASQSASLTQL